MPKICFWDIFEVNSRNSNQFFELKWDRFSVSEHCNFKRTWTLSCIAIQIHNRGRQKIIPHTLTFFTWPAIYFRCIKRRPAMSSAAETSARHIFERFNSPKWPSLFQAKTSAIMPNSYKQQEKQRLRKAISEYSTTINSLQMVAKKRQVSYSTLQKLLSKWCECKQNSARFS